MTWNSGTTWTRATEGESGYDLRFTLNDFV